ncbi:hypothetical protein GCM10011344_14850 [Dokdonia pacifica]|uniref:Uncharacterized phage-associated protein n=1 Tax=Dokdonia pacifica TaxID=1627892 RepID=A0A238W617_9FLAO|nr:type II toxin-antitoxin system antitoxin SocA domain-containing protein [Dokdonia pacifica]GGG15285.1 hypothetical protein GCM10011344_14850 [Dokdonia pacifica]SNR41129.1 Uncharacterized phage-associated protein [Dokdonia pacifica]
MYKPIDISNYFIKKYSSIGALTPMKLIKLTYISYAWYMTLFKGKKFLLAEKPQAWEYGPVFPSLYSELRHYGKIGITRPIKPLLKKTVAISQDDSIFLDRMWSMYGEFGGIYLSAITHTTDSPWDRAYKKGRNTIIKDEDILEHYQSKLKNID